MSNRSNTVPYTNARRDGRTAPGMFEVIEVGDPRHWTSAPKVVPNRADLRRRGVRGPRQARYLPACRQVYRGPFAFIGGDDE